MKKILSVLCLVGFLLASCDFSAPYRGTLKVSSKGITTNSTLMIKVNGEYVFEYYMADAINGTIDVSVPLDQYVTFEWREYIDSYSFAADTPWMSAAVTRYITDEDTGSEIVIEPVRIDDSVWLSEDDMTTLSSASITSGSHGDLDIYYYDTDYNSAYGSATYSDTSIIWPYSSGALSTFGDVIWDIYDSYTETVTSYYKYNSYLDTSGGP